MAGTSRRLLNIGRPLLMASSNNINIGRTTSLNIQLNLSSKSSSIATPKPVNMASPLPDAELLKTKYPAKAHFKRVKQYMLSQATTTGSVAGGVVYLESSKSKLWPNSDQEQPIRQDRHFYYLSGCELADCFILYDIDSEKSCLFIPPLDPSEVIWSGLPVTEKDAIERYDVDSVRTHADLQDYLDSTEIGKKTIFTIDGLVSPHVTFDKFGTTNKLNVKEAIDESRVVKDAYEIALIRRANIVSAKAHAAVWKAARHASTEAELHAVFVRECIANGLKNQAYDPIMASGTNAATLHYIHNDQPLKGRLNMLVDASAECRTYAADITRTFPLGGKFTKESKEIYSLVLDIQKTVMSRLKAGVSWDGCQKLTHEMVVDGLLKLGVLKGDRTKILEAQTSAAFFPHGLGHYLGMDTHDTGGHPNYHDKERIYQYLRVRGEIPSGAVITVEPGVYFCKFIIEPYLKDDKHKDFIDADVLQKYWEVGGVRIEDDILITDYGFENLTDVPKEIDELESLMAAA